ncbi:MAG TPA: DNA ligase D [Pirellulales bacterium]|jgi:bifunctional non-homologous end joining protein LigD|nr:DNA ligase D [Pirellulales bacterium]
MGLKEYKRKRNFRVTPEPQGRELKHDGRLYVIQKHAASHLHYDFRLELQGVLKSWAVPKGPSLDPSVKRLAMQVEDHPVDYGDFEGIIPEGEYGGGTVMLWDRGWWEAVGDPHEAYRAGRLKFILHGEKLHGGWMLVRRGGSKSSDERHWFLFKERDDEARGPRGKDILLEKSRSVTTDRDLDEIAAERDRVWGSNRNGAASSGAAHKTKRVAKKRVAVKSAKAKPTRSRAKAPAAGKLEGAKRGKLPAFVEPQLATLTREPPEGDEWVHEIKLDGYRMIARIDRGKVKLLSRREQDWTGRLPHLVEALGRLPLKQAILDGEVVAEESSGRTSFQLLQNAFRDQRSGDLKYYLFDLMYLDGYSLLGASLEDRKQALAALLGSKAAGPLMLSEHLAGDGPKFFKEACRMGLEGIICKRRDRPYLPGRGYDWLKIKCVRREEFVIGGYTEPGGARHGFGALLVGYHEPGSRRLIYAGKVGTGYSEKTLAELTARLKPLEQDASPFADVTRRVGPVRHARWVKPVLVAQIEFSEWTNDGRLRHPSFQALREDKAAAEVVRDRALPVEQAVDASEKQAGKKRGSRVQRNHKDRNHQGTMSAKKQATQAKQRGVDEALEGIDVRLTHPDKVLYPDQGITKLDLARYYAQVGSWMLPHLKDRPLVLVRCPEGQQGECFYQKHAGAGTPAALRQVAIREKSKTGHYVLVDDVQGLVSLVQIGVLEIHVWGSRADRLEQPDRLVFDLDPDPSVKWPRVVESARQIGDFLRDLGLESFVKTTGGKGLHVVVPISRKGDWDEVREFCQAAAQTISDGDPGRYTLNMSKAARGGKIFLDYLRNARGATSVAPYSTRSRPGATVSTPLEWDELTGKTDAGTFDIAALPKRLAKLKRDPWQNFFEVKQSITAAMRKTVGLAKRS